MMKCETADEVSKLEYACTHTYMLSYQKEETALENSYICIISLN